MKIASVSFAGKKEIHNYAKKAQPLTNEEKTLVKTACEFHDLEVDKTSDGDFLNDPNKARKVTAEYLDALDKVGASKLAYLIAVDTINAPVIKNDVLPFTKYAIIEAALDIASKSKEVTKKDLIKNFDVLH